MIQASQHDHVGGAERLGRYFADRPHLKFRYQGIQMAGTLIALLLVILRIR